MVDSDCCVFIFDNEYTVLIFECENYNKIDLNIIYKMYILNLYITNTDETCNI